MLGMAARYDAVATNPVRDVELPKRERKAPVAIREADLEELQADVDAWVSEQPANASTRRQLGDAIEMYLVTGARTGEVLGMLAEDFDTARHTWTISGTVKRTTEHGLYRQPWPKTKKRTTVVVPVESMGTVRRLIMASPTALLFHTRGGGPIEPANFRRALREFRAAMDGRWDDVTPRSFRKAVATILDHEHGSERAAGQLGHASDAVTKRHYIQPVDVAEDSSASLARFARGS
jgi:integrase